jgi:hypothetical protein
LLVAASKIKLSEAEERDRRRSAGQYNRSHRDVLRAKIVLPADWMDIGTIPRIGHPPPKQRIPAAEKRLRIVSMLLIALGVTSTIRVFATGNRPPRSAPHS